MQQLYPGYRKNIGHAANLCLKCATIASAVLSYLTKSRRIQEQLEKDSLAEEGKLHGTSLGGMEYASAAEFPLRLALISSCSFILLRNGGKHARDPSHMTILLSGKTLKPMDIPPQQSFTKSHSEFSLSSPKMDERKSKANEYRVDEKPYIEEAEIASIQW